ncbi:response regulator transcription factor [Chloroflexia bacterium SDU3-3]|nr:response regulator transcription factor [Chloroflexia bacterium SDU3-3]
MVRLFVVDDHPVVRHGIVAILRYEADIEVVGEAADGQDAIDGILARSPDVVLLDLRLPTRSGIEVMREVHAQKPGVRFLVLTTYDTDAYIAPALAAGAQGYLLKDATPDDLVKAVHTAIQGGVTLEPGVAARLLGRVAESGRGEELSARELAVLRLLVGGASNKIIAAQLYLSENTVKSHMSHIFSKLGVQSRAEAVATALQRGLIPMDQLQ